MSYFLLNLKIYNILIQKNPEIYNILIQKNPNSKN